MSKNKQSGEVTTKIPNCPVCMSNMTIPIYQCKSGHSLCCHCTKRLQPPLCPLCRQDITQTRNLMLEEIILAMRVPCPNKSFGCVFTVPNNDLDKHVSECIYRLIDCPVGIAFGKCSWNGQLIKINEHFQERHADIYNPNNDLQLKANLNEDERYIFLIPKQKNKYILTVKIDLLQKMAFWTIQFIGSKFAAQKNSYEIQIYSKQNENKKIIYNELCFNDELKPDDVFRIGKCAMVPLAVMKHFISDGKMSFKFDIRTAAPYPFKGNKNKPNTNNNAGPPKKSEKFHNKNVK